MKHESSSAQSLSKTTASTRRPASPVASTGRRSSDVRRSPPGASRSAVRTQSSAAAAGKRRAAETVRHESKKLKSGKSFNEVVKPKDSSAGRSSMDVSISRRTGAMLVCVVEYDICFKCSC